MLRQRLHNLYSVCAVQGTRWVYLTMVLVLHTHTHVYRGSEQGTMSLISVFLIGTQKVKVVLELWDSTMEMRIGDRYPRW